MQSPLVVTFAAFVFAAGVHAQVVLGRFGHLVFGQNGTAGVFCHQFDCTPRPLAVVAGETLTMRVNAPFQTFYAIGLSLSATQCVTVPGIGNSLTLDLPIVVVAAGMVTMQTPILSCWDGTVTLPLTVPAGLPVGFTFASQAIADLPGPTPGLAFSVAVQMTVQ